MAVALLYTKQSLVVYPSSPSIVQLKGKLASILGGGHVGVCGQKNGTRNKVVTPRIPRTQYVFDVLTLRADSVAVRSKRASSCDCVELLLEHVCVLPRSTVG